jgi:thioredoxin-dependent peroxiredoxin
MSYSGETTVNQLAVFCVGVCSLAILAAMTNSVSSAQTGELKVGDKAPAFKATDDQGNPWNSSEHVGKKIVIVYFYPADFTGGCTQQACAFRDDSKPLADKGVEVVGVSGDSVKTHAAFKKEHMLNFTLLSDGQGDIAAKFGVPFSKKQGTFNFKGETIVREGTANRWTVVIDTNGMVAARYLVKDAAGDSKKVLEIVDKLKK